MLDTIVMVTTLFVVYPTVRSTLEVYILGYRSDGEALFKRIASHQPRSESSAATRTFTAVAALNLRGLLLSVQGDISARH